MSEETAAGSARTGYVLLVGRPCPDRDATEQALLAAQMEVSVSTEADVLVARDLMPPVLVVLDDASAREERMASLRRLQGHPALYGIPILVMAYEHDIDSYSGAITKGAAAYLVKPGSVHELVSVARRLSGWVASTEQTEKRRRLRRPLIMRVQVMVRSRNVKLPGQVVDVSGGGCRVEVPEAIAPGEVVRVILQGYDTSTYVALGGEVCWHKEVSRALHVVGVRFTGTTALLAGKLLGFVASGLT